MHFGYFDGYLLNFRIYQIRLVTLSIKVYPKMQLHPVLYIAVLGLTSFVVGSPTPATALSERGNVVCEVIPP